MINPFILGVNPTTFNMFNIFFDQKAWESLIDQLLGVAKVLPKVLLSKASKALRDISQRKAPGVGSVSCELEGLAHCEAALMMSV